MKKILMFFLNKEFITFILIGIFNTLGGSVFSVMYSYAFNVNVAFVLGYLTSLMVAYFLNSKFNFKKSLSLVGLIRFSVSYIPNFIIQNLCVLFLYNYLSWNKILVYFLAAIIGVPITFVFLKIYAFKNRPEI